MNAIRRRQGIGTILVAGATLAMLTSCASTNSYYAGVGLLTNCSNFKSPLLFVGEEKHDDIGYRLLGRIDPGLRERVVFEGSYTSLGDTKFNGLYEGIEDQGKIETETVEVSVGYRYPFTDKFSAGGRIGAAYVDVNESENFGGEPYSSSASETIVSAGFVARYAINKSWGVTGFYDHYPDIGKADQTGEGDAEVFGVSFDFRFGGSNSDD
jgi:hypothetical protein